MKINPISLILLASVLAAPAADTTLAVSRQSLVESPRRGDHEAAVSAKPPYPTAADTNLVRHSYCAPAEPAATELVSLTAKSLYRLDSVWTNDYGAAANLASLQGRPQIVTMFFANCVYACPLLVYQMKQIEEALPENLRNKVGFTLVSFDTERDTPAVLHNYRQHHELDAKRWTLLRGSPDAVLDLAAPLNVKFKKDAQGQFLHSNVITLLNADGELVCQQLGLTADHNEIIRRASELARKEKPNPEPAPLASAAAE
jgi:protein SCO1/2